MECSLCWVCRTSLFLSFGKLEVLCCGAVNMVRSEGGDVTDTAQTGYSHTQACRRELKDGNPDVESFL